MAGTYAIVKIPQAMLEDALNHMKHGQSYTIHIDMQFGMPDPETLDEVDRIINDEEMQDPKTAIDRLTAERPINADEIIDARKRGEQNA